MNNSYRNKHRYPCGRVYVTASALKPVTSYYASQQHQHVGLLQRNTEDAPVSMGGRVVADDSTSEELLCRGSSMYMIVISPTCNLNDSYKLDL